MMNISTAFAAGRLTIYLAGELDHHEARGAIRSIDELLDEYLPRDCVLDMSGLSFMDSSGIGLILGRQRSARTLGTTLQIQHAPAQLRRVLQLAGIRCTDAAKTEE